MGKSLTVIVLHQMVMVAGGAVILIWAVFSLVRGDGGETATLIVGLFVITGNLSVLQLSRNLLEHMRDTSHHSGQG